jgi:hypothetical protein
MRAHVPDPKAELVIDMTVAQARELDQWMLPDDAPDSLLQLRAAIRHAIYTSEIR